MTSTYENEPVYKLVIPIWGNICWINAALDQYDAIGKHAVELKETTTYAFWGNTQRFSLDWAVIGICKLYDTSNRSYKKYTIPELIECISPLFKSDHRSRLCAQSTYNFHFLNDKENLVFSAFNDASKFDEARGNLVSKLKEIISDKMQESSLKRLSTYRDKFLAHHEQVDEILKEALKSLPPLEEIRKLNHLASEFCQFSANIFIPDTTLLDLNRRRSCMNTLNVIARDLEKNLDDPNDLANFFSECNRWRS